jgi:hypothetical protein
VGFFEFADKNAFTALVLAFMVMCVVSMVSYRITWAVNRILRSRNIKAHGWPPVHCDADGDFRPGPELNPIVDPDEL